MLREDTSQVSLAGLGLAVGLLASTPLQLLRNHRHARAIGAQIDHRRIAALALVGLCRPLLPLLGGITDALNHPLNLTGRNADTTGLFEVPLGFKVGRLIGAFQTKEFGQGWGVADFQSERRVDWIMALLFARMIVVVTLELEVPENALGVDPFSALALFSRLGLVGAVNPIDGLLEHPAHQIIG
jgi:hypothetical protein